MLQLGVCKPQLKIPQVAVKTRRSQIKKTFDIAGNINRGDSPPKISDDSSLQEKKKKSKDPETLNLVFYRVSNS